MRVRDLAVVLSVGVGLPAASAAAAIPESWPPRPASGALYVHFGEEHLTDEDGPVLFPKVVEETARWRPALAVASGDKSDDGTTEKLTAYREVLLRLDAAGVPWYAAVGNHDRQAPPGAPGGLLPVGDLTPYIEVFAERPFPFGDGPSVSAPGFAPRARPADDPPGASSHYYLDHGTTRFVFIDNSCYSISNCAGPLQNPPVNDQFAFLREVATEATSQGKVVLVVMHMPTQDPRDQSYTTPAQFNHTMGKGATPDNALFESAAAQTGVDWVLVGHIKGLWEYTGEGDVRYAIDGGAGGSLYTNDPSHVGVDTGYWYGYRLLHVSDGTVTTDVVPLLSDLVVNGPDHLGRGERAEFSAVGRQPAEHGVRVERLELRDPDRSRPDGAALPTPARIWTSSDPEVLAPVAAGRDDPRRDAARQTAGGAFVGRCPGRATVGVTSGFVTASRALVVGSGPGRIIAALDRAPRRIARARRSVVAGVQLAQPARVLVRIRRGKSLIATLHGSSCRPPGWTRARWTPRRPGRYVVELRVRSDRRVVVRKSTVIIR